MNRRRLIWLGLPLIALGVIVAAWFWLSQRDADFVVVGPKTKGVRDNFALLETTIDPAEFRDCKTGLEVIARLNRKVKPIRDHDEAIWLLIGWQKNVHWNLFRVDIDAFVAEGFGSKHVVFAPTEWPVAAEPLTIKQFLRVTCANSGLPNVKFIVHGNYILVTTAKQAQEERTHYLDSVSIYDRMHNFWKEMTGTVEADVPEPLILDIT